VKWILILFLAAMQAVGASKRVFELLDRMPKQPPAGDARPMGTPEGGDVVFDNVWCAGWPYCYNLIHPCHWRSLQHA
jgi:hypothetical protein